MDGQDPPHAKLPRENLCSGPRQKPRPRASATATHEIPARVDRCSPEQPSFSFASGSSLYDQARGQTVATTHRNRGWGPLAVITLPPTPTPTTLLQQRCSPTACRCSLSLSPPVHRVERVGGVTEGERKDRRFTGCRCGAAAGPAWACRCRRPAVVCPTLLALPPGRVGECLVAWFGQWFLWLGNNWYSTVSWIAQLPRPTPSTHANST